MSPEMTYKKLYFIHDPFSAFNKVHSFKLESGTNNDRRLRLVKPGQGTLPQNFYIVFTAIRQ